MTTTRAGARFKYLSYNQPLQGLETLTIGNADVSAFKKLYVHITTDSLSTLLIEFSNDGLNYGLESINDYIVSPTSEIISIHTIGKWCRMTISNKDVGAGSYYRLSTYGTFLH